MGDRPPPPAQCAPEEVVRGAPAQGQPVEAPVPGAVDLPPLATVTHTTYAQPARGIPVNSNPFYPSAGGDPYAQGRVAGGMGGVQAGQHGRFMLADGTTVVIQEGTGSMEHAIARSLARSLRLFALIDVFICVINVFIGYFWLAIAIIGPLCGFYGAKNYLRGPTLAYVVFCFLALIWRMAVFLMPNMSVGTQVLAFLMVLVQCYILRLAIRFYRMLKEFTDDDLALLRAMEHLPARLVYW
jgi:hypothetical protein